MNNKKEYLVIYNINGTRKWDFYNAKNPKAAKEACYKAQKFNNIEILFVEQCDEDTTDSFLG